MDTCTVCNKKKFEIRNGERFILRCDCDWKSSYLRRMAACVSQDFHKKWPKDFDPEIFDPKKHKISPFISNFIKVQKAAAIIKLWQFAFKETELQDGRKGNALLAATASNRNLFIRGPVGSGRGLLSASIKKLAACREIETTSIPSEFDIFKMECLEASQFGRPAEDMRLKIESKYVEPTIMVLENMKAEVQFKSELAHSNFIPQRRKFKASSVIDSVFTRRIMKTGSIIITSSAFLGEVMDDYGERLMEVLSDQTKSTIILLFSIPEAEELKKALIDRLNYMDVYAKEFTSKKSAAGKPGRIEIQGLQEQQSLLEEGLYLFSGLNKTFKSKVGKEVVGKGIEDIYFNPGSYKDLTNVCLRIQEEEKTKPEVYRKAVVAAISNAFKSKKQINSKLSEYECMEVSKMFAKSDSDSDTETLTAKAKQLAKEMSGGK